MVRENKRSHLVGTEVCVGDSRDRPWVLGKDVASLGIRMGTTTSPTHGQHALYALRLVSSEFGPPYLKIMFAGTVHTGKGQRHNSHSDKLPMFLSFDVEYIRSRTPSLSSSSPSAPWRHPGWCLKPRKSGIFSPLLTSTSIWLNKIREIVCGMSDRILSDG